MMKKIILMAGLLIASLAQAQVTVFNGTQEITDGYVYTSPTAPGAVDKLNLLVTNTSPDESIRLKLKMIEKVNANNDADMIQFCFATQCFSSASLNTTVPSATGGLLLSPGASNAIEGETTTEDHFYSVYEGDTPGQLVKYKMALIQVEANGAEAGTLMTFTYQYGGLVGLKDLDGLKNIGIAINNTVVNKTLDVTANLNAKLELFDVTGKQLKTIAITNGSQSVDLSGLTTAVYIARFTTEENKTSQVRIVKN